MGELGHKLRKNPGLPKGRTVDPSARQAVIGIIGELPRRRDLLIEHLHRLQDHFGYLSMETLAALAEVMNLPMAEVYETASFYAHFDIVREGQTPPPPVTVRLCGGPSCCMAGAQDLARRTADALPADARVELVPCIGRCDQAPAATVTRAAGGHKLVDRADCDALIDASRQVPAEPATPPAPLFAEYRKAGGYGLLEACLAGRRTRDEIIDAIDQCSLRGCGGAGFPTAQKWKVVRSYPGPRLMAVNADEGEPGTFKDRYYLERDPNRMLEGMLIAAWVVEAEAIYIYLRDEYPHLRQRLIAELEALRQSDLPGLPPIHLRRGAGAYICGEESAMIESIEGKRGLPRLRPPYVAQRGLFDQPTLVNNVETLYWVRDMVEKGAEVFLGHGRRGKKGLRSFSVSGRVVDPGVKLAPAGISVRELIDEYCGGMLPGHTLVAYQPGGASGGIFSADQADLPLDFGTFEPLGGFLGSAAVIILSDHDDVKEFASQVMEFFAHESCGQCTPCRVGTHKAAELLRRPVWDASLLSELARVMQDASICGLGQAAPNTWATVLRNFGGKA